MKRGEVWTISGHSDYASKTRPAVIVQSDIFEDTASITVCLITSDQTDADLFRIPIAPSEANGLKLPSRMMVDKIDTLPKSKLGRRIGQLSTENITRLNRAMIVFLGLAAPSQTRGQRLKICMLSRISVHIEDSGLEPPRGGKAVKGPN